MAIITRWHMPPENWWAYWLARLSGSGMPHQRQHLEHALLGLLGRQAGMQCEQPRHLPPTVMSGLRAVRGVCETMAISVPRTCRSSSSVERREIDAAEHDGAGRQAAGPADQAQDRDRRHRLAGARFADQAQDLALADLEVGAVDRLDLAGVGVEADGQIPDLDDGRSSDAPHARIEEVAQAVADQIEGQNHHHDGEAREQEQPPFSGHDLRAPSAVIEPHSLCGGWMPSPMKDSDAMVSSA